MNIRTLFGRALKPSEQRALQVLAAAVFLFVLLEFVMLPMMDSADQLRASLPLREKTLVKYQSRVALAGTQELDKTALQARVAEAEKSLLDSRTPPMAFAELQELVKRLMAGQGIEMQNAVFMPLRADKQGYASVPLAVAFDCTLDQFVNFMIAARGGPKALALDQLGITSTPPRADKKKFVSVRIVIRALMTPEAAPALAAAPKG